jgi:hypothetical protein
MLAQKGRGTGRGRSRGLCGYDVLVQGIPL